MLQGEALVDLFWYPLPLHSVSKSFTNLKIDEVLILYKQKHAAEMLTLKKILPKLVYDTIINLQ